jgi:hypothetical protein
MRPARRTFLQAAGAGLALGSLPALAQWDLLPPMAVYASPGSACCEHWMAEMRAGGFIVQSKPMADVTPLKRKLGVPESLYSCHTATVAGYVIEGHVPAADIKRLLRERTQVRGLAAPGMVDGLQATIAFDDRGARVFERH